MTNQTKEESISYKINKNLINQTKQKNMSETGRKLSHNVLVRGGWVAGGIWK